jgi:16S rRNA (cytosine1402-N4)-methyltransferase
MQQIEKPQHQPVMLVEAIKALNLREDGIYVDATLGRAGHTKAILEQLGPKGRVLALDRDPAAIETATQLSASDPRFIFKSAAFSDVQLFCEEQSVVGRVDGILMDLGVSSPQLDTAERGFSFRLLGPLDMRMDTTQGMTAAEWINSADETEIAFILKEYGEERFHRRIARAIVNARNIEPITTTLQLAEIVSKANPAWEKHKHPATRSFQAIRIWINRELEEVASGLTQGLQILAPKGRLVVISFHSLEDRLVKHFFQKNEQGDDVPRHLPLLHYQINQKCRRIGKKMKPSEEEVFNNARARSAILRVAEKVSN